MLFRSMDTFINTSLQPRVLPHLRTYIGTLNTTRHIVTDRFINAVGYESNFVVLLRKILADADIPLLQKKATDLDVYLDILSYTHTDLDAIFDSVETGLSFKNMLIAKNKNNTEEFLIPVQCADPLASLPLDKCWNEWQKIRPVRLVDFDSTELTFNLYQDQIIFKKDFPSRVVITIDTTALVLQYLNFLKYDTSGIYQPEYLHRYVLVHVLKDLQDIWLCNMYNKFMNDPSFQNEIYLDINTLIGDQYYGYVGVEFPLAVKEISFFLKAVANGTIAPCVFLESLNLSDTDVISFLKNLLGTTVVEDHKQNRWCEYLKEIRWLSLFYSVFSLQPDFIGTRNLKTALRRDLPILQATRIWNNCRDKKISGYIETNIQEWINKVTPNTKGVVK